MGSSATVISPLRPPLTRAPISHFSSPPSPASVLLIFTSISSFHHHPFLPLVSLIIWNVFPFAGLQGISPFSYFLHICFNISAVFLFPCGKRKLLFQIFCFPFFCILPPPLFASPLPLLCSFCGPYYCQRLSLEQIASLLKLRPGRPCRPLLLYCPL